MNKLRQLCFYGALIVALGATYWFPVGNGFDSSPKSSLDDSKDEPHFRNAVESRSSTAAFQAIAKSAEWQPMTNTNDFCQAVNFWNDSKTLVVRNKEWNHLIDAWNFTYYEIRASFEISFVSGNGISDEFYVTGVARNGDSVIEHWKAVASIGSPFLSRTQFALPLGEPAGVAPSQGGFIGGGYLDPSSRVQVLDAQRDEIFRGNELGPLWCAISDPNGRFVIALSHSGSIYQVSTIGQGNPTEILSPSNMPYLSFMTNMYQNLHPDFGMCYIAEPVRSVEFVDRIIVLYDFDNDGVMDEFGQFNRTDYHDLHQAEGPGTWSNDFLNYFD